MDKYPLTLLDACLNLNVNFGNSALNKGHVHFGVKDEILYIVSGLNEILRVGLDCKKLKRKLRKGNEKCNFHISHGPQVFSHNLTLFLDTTNFYISSLPNLPLLSIFTPLPSIPTSNSISQFHPTKWKLS